VPSPVVIENPILNSPYDEPSHHFRFDENGITNEVVDERRPSSYFVAIPPAKRAKAKQTFETEWTSLRIEESKDINRIREQVNLWRQGGRQHITPTTRRLIEYWTDPDRERRLFFAQIEALDTAIYLTEAADKVGQSWILSLLKAKADAANPGLFRVAHKMATGSGKTVVMAMLIAWQTLNKVANPQDARFASRFLVVTPGITIKDRLRVLLPSDPNNYYRELDVVPPELTGYMGQASIVVTNFHGFLARTKVANASKLHRQLMDRSAITESTDEMVRRVCRELGSSKTQIVVLNDEAHHCYRHKPEPEVEEKLVGDEAKEAKARDEEARVWLSGLEAVQKKIGIKTVYDLSATPFFLTGSGYRAGTLFPWVVSDFALIDAIESGIVKVPRVPISDDSGLASGVTYRDLWPRISGGLPKKGRKATADTVDQPILPKELQGALNSLYSNYEKAYRRWEKSANRATGTPPVFIVVCANTAVSKLLYDHIGGYETTTAKGGTVVHAGELPLFSNAAEGKWIDRPNTILIDSTQLESGEGMSEEYKRIAAAEIAEFKHELKERFPGRDVEEITDEDLLREVMNTVGKPDKLGEHVRCVVSVSMLTEGWDANTVTHILGVRAFSTQLLCEQVVGRGLRRRSYTLNEEGRFDPEYAEVYGVPFSFIPTNGSVGEPKPRPTPTRVRALEERIAAEISFPRLVGYRYEVSGQNLTATFKPVHHLALSTQGVPTKVEVAPIVGEHEIHTLDSLKTWRLQRIEFEIARRLATRYFSGNGEDDQPWLFPQLLAIVRRWIAECVTLKDSAFIQMLRIDQFESDAIDRIIAAIISTQGAGTTVQTVLRPYDPLGSSRYIDFDTTKTTYATNHKCHVSHVVEDSSWETKLAAVLEEMDEVVRYVKNQKLGFVIPYTIDGVERGYLPDFIAVLDDGTNLIIEVTGEQKRDKDQKVRTAHELWLPAVNGHGGFGHWDFIEILDPWDAQNTIRAYLKSKRVESGRGVA
jgi:type III restriction enzyme